MNIDKNEIAVSGVSALSARGTSIDLIWESIKGGRNFHRHEDFKLTGFKAGPYLKDRRMLKAVSFRDSYGLAAIEELKNKVRLDEGGFDDYQKGMFIGASPSSIYDNENYSEAVRATQKSTGIYDESEFGKHCMSARPTTLLLGLPNNVLCYGSMIAQAKGLNNNFTSAEISSVIALRSALRSIRRGRLKCSIVGGYSSLTDSYMQNLRARRGLLRSEDDEKLEILPALTGETGTITADSAAFSFLEPVDSAKKRGLPLCAKVLSADIVSSGEGFMTDAGWGNSIRAIEKSLVSVTKELGVDQSNIGLVMFNFLGITGPDQAMISGVRNFLGKEISNVAAGSLSRHMGNLQEASGVMEFSIARRIMDEGRVPNAIAVSDVAPDFAETVSSDRKLALTVVATETGDLGYILFEALV